ncbi:uncharacterized protein VP01_1585g3 [Puccinia sorghi]|uniref:Fluoride ion transporter CrcB n=1 Tax=Puccinia sorghi TaxID=27349 RepID=A0A0L6VHL0_9BASI|nr:uncharacterized protein VP01_1585g3 [Puccinia sorghi]
MRTEAPGCPSRWLSPVRCTGWLGGGVGMTSPNFLVAMSHRRPGRLLLKMSFSAAPADDGPSLPTPEVLAKDGPVAPSRRSLEPANPKKDTSAACVSPPGDTPFDRSSSNSLHPHLLRRLGPSDKTWNYRHWEFPRPKCLQSVAGTSRGLLSNGHIGYPSTKIRHPLLYFGITTGYCGSVTTFSSWMLQVFQSFSNTSQFSRDRFSDFLDGLNLTYVTIGLCLFALQMGFVVGSFIEATITSMARRSNLRTSTCTSQSPNYAARKISMVVLILVGPLTWLGSLVLCIWGPIRYRGPVTYSMVISPTGTILRYYFAKLNARPFSTKHGFPTGTYLANVVATGLLALFSVLQYTSAARTNLEYCAGLQGLRDGFCGCLSTISTFFLELHRAGPCRQNFRYALASWISGQLLCLLLFGIYFWSHDPQERCAFPK